MRHLQKDQTGTSRVDLHPIRQSAMTHQMDEPHYMGGGEINQAFVKQIAVENDLCVCFSQVFYFRLMNSTIAVPLNH